MCKLYKKFVFAASFCKLAKIICRIFAVCTLRHFIMRFYRYAALFACIFAGLHADNMQFRSFFLLPTQTNAIARLKIMHFPLSLRSSARLFCCPNCALTESALKNSYNWCMPATVSARLRPCAENRPANLFLKSCKTQKTQQAELFRPLRINTGHTAAVHPISVKMISSGFISLSRRFASSSVPSPLSSACVFSSSALFSVCAAVISA